MFAFILYSDAENLNGGWMYDDQAAIVLNPMVTGLSSHSLAHFAVFLLRLGLCPSSGPG